jgi:hypothetical protein
MTPAPSGWTTACEAPRFSVWQRVVNVDYGRGTVVLSSAANLHIEWDKPMLKGTVRRIYDHDPSFARWLNPLTIDADAREVPAPDPVGCDAEFPSASRPAVPTPGTSPLHV